MEPQGALLDQPEITQFLFYPRKESGRKPPGNAVDMDIPVENGIRIGVRLYSTSSEKPHILFFHGNGEIAEDYDDIGPVYTDYGINFIVAENTYQGYTRVVSSAGGIGEAMLSRAFRKNRNQIVLAIKVGMKFGPEKDDLTPSH